MPHPSRPYSYPNRVLVVISGESPQVITETLFALANSDSPFHPTRTVIITTALGRERAIESLWGTQKQLENLLTSHKLPDPGLTPDNILVPVDTDGRLDTDAHTEDALDRMGNLILTTLGTMGGEKNIAMHVSLAGGRKTMSYLAGLALSLVGRPQDRLSHVVLSDSRFERCRAFYFPPNPPEYLELDTRDVASGKKLKLWTGDVQVRIVDVLFIRLRELLGEDLVDPGNERPLTELVAEANAALAEPDEAVVEFDTHLGIVTCNKIAVKFPPVQLAFYYLLAKRGDKGFHARANDEECLDYLDHYSHIEPGGDDMRKRHSYLGKIETSGDRLFLNKRRGADGHWPSSSSLLSTQYGQLLDSRANKFSPDFTNTNKTLRKFLGHVRSRPFEIQSRKGHYTFPENVTIVWKDARPRREI